MIEIFELLYLYKCKEIFMFYVDVIYFQGEEVKKRCRDSRE